MDRSGTDFARRITVIGWGNDARGDDALGLAAITRLDLARASHPGWPELHLVTAHQLEIEHALDLECADIALFIDAAGNIRRPYCLEPVVVDAAASWTAHAADPGWLLQVYRQAFRSVPPPSFLLRLRATEFRIGRPMSRTAAHSLDQALPFMKLLLDRAWTDNWLAACTAPERLVRRAA